MPHLDIADITSRLPWMPYASIGGYNTQKFDFTGLEATKHLYYKLLEICLSNLYMITGKWVVYHTWYCNYIQAHINVLKLITTKVFNMDTLQGVKRWSFGAQKHSISVFGVFY